MPWVDASHNQDPLCHTFSFEQNSEHTLKDENIEHVPLAQQLFDFQRSPPWDAIWPKAGHMY